MSINKRLISTGAGAVTCTTDSTDPFGDSSGVALYNLDFDVSTAPDGTDYSGSPTDVDFGVDGQINYGARFNGSSSRINTGYQIPSGLSGFSVSAWVKAASVKTQYIVGDLGTGGASADGMFQINISSSNVLRASVGGVASQNIATLSSYIDAWTHIVVTTDSSGNIVGYVNGSQVGTASGNSLAANTRDFIIGMFGDTSHSSTFNGDIDQVRIFSKALSSDEVDDLFEETACVYTSTTDIVNYPTGTTPIAYYKMDNSSEDYSTGGNDGTDTNVEYRFGRFGQAAVFNGSSSRIATGLTLPADSTMSFSFWLKSASNSSGNNYFLSDFDSSASNNSSRLSLAVTASNGFRIWISNGSSNWDSTDDISLSSYINVWMNLVVTIDGTDVKVYINGGTPTTLTSTVAFGTAGSRQQTIGRAGDYNGAYYEGSIDQVRIFSTALDSDQVSQLYNEKPETDTSNFKTVLYEGNDATKHFVSNVGLDLDVDNGGDGGLVWVKNRDGSFNHILVDSIRGANNLLFSDTTAAALTSNTTLLSSLEKTGFFVGYDGTDVTNGASNSYVAWVWKGGGDAVNIGVNSITGSTPSIASDVSANTAAGFSIVKYTGNNTAGAKVAHGLDYPPEMIIIKNLDNTVAARNWAVYHSGVDANPENYFLRLNSTIDKLDFPIWNDTAPDSDVFTLGNTSQVGEANDNNNEHIAYCFHSVSGISSIGSYEGNGSTATTTITTGFEPSWVMIKRTDSANNWVIFDNKRDTTSPLSKILYADSNSSEAEGGTTTSITISSTGFSMSTSQFGGSINTDGGQYIYMAFK